MRRVALRGLLARKTRLALTALAVALGVTLISGTYVFTDTIDASFDRIFSAAYKGADIILRTAGYTAPIKHAWRITNQANAFCNLAYTASVCMCGSDGSFDSMGEGMFCSFDGTVMVQGGGRADEIITAELRPDLAREARTGWGVENNMYQLYHRGYVAVSGGAQDCPYTYMADMAAGTYKLPWPVDVTDGTGCGFDAPTRRYQGAA